ncbi:integrase [Altererythrobacter marinus]|uniref:Integrase n=1 Tax=Pelagerythrobacter marinus TaxID=538382 RepID=A0ABW9UVX6_9SPHN|nr:integrase [Pelagerythrobacter marinus]MXO67745.1 integrase [Pelagerythrobacter marinus]
MSREDSPFTIGKYWLDKRRDGKSPDIWQIATYSEKSRSVVYRSTKRRTVDEAEAVLRAYEANVRSLERGQDAADAELVPHLFHYVRERGPDIHRVDTIKSSFRAWIGFLMQDPLGTEATVADITPGVIARFRRWRMAPHSWEVEWGGKTFRHTSQGVSGHAVQRNIEDLRAALHHAEGERRIEAPKIPSVNKRLRNSAPPKLLTPEQLGAIWGYAREDVGIWREIALMVATACRPGTAMAFDPAFQWEGDILDLQPAREETDKRNAIVPVIEPLRPILREWKAEPHERVGSRKRWWRTARRVLDMPNVEAYHIRHTISTHLDRAGVPGAQLSGLTGHIPASRGIARTTSAHYLHYDPRNAPEAVAALTTFFQEVERHADLWCADHKRTIPVRGKPISLVTKAGLG